MSNVRVPRPCDAYSGKELFLFVSYAHADADRVYPEIKTLFDQGYRIWFDEGIDPGNEWPDVIARAIDGSAIVVVFIAQNAIQSPNVSNEIHFALNHRKPLVAVHLEEISLPPSLELRMGNIQAVMKWNMSEHDYLRKMSRCLEKWGVQSVQPVAPEPPPRDPASSASPPAPKNEWPPTIRPGPDGEEMSLIPAGEFLMGSNEDDDEKPPHNVDVDAFYVDKHEVTNQRFDRFVKATGFRTEAEQDGGGFFWDGTGWKRDESVNWQSPLHPGDSIRDKMELPVVHVSWEDAVAFCRWSGKRLPTEAEWEKAARGGLSGKKYPWGDEKPTGKACDEDCSGVIRPKDVGSSAPNGYGLFDMAGNVWEWCSDWYDPDYYKRSVAANPKGPEEPIRFKHFDTWVEAARVVRGGSSTQRRLLRCASRLHILPSVWYSFLGFRCVRSIRCESTERSE